MRMLHLPFNFFSSTEKCARVLTPQINILIDFPLFGLRQGETAFKSTINSIKNLSK